MKTTMRYHTASHLLEWILSTRKVVKCVGEIVEKKTHSFTAGGNVNSHNHYGKQYGLFLKKLRIELTFDPEHSVLGISLKILKTSIYEDVCMPMLIAALFIVSQT